MIPWTGATAESIPLQCQRLAQNSNGDCGMGQDAGWCDCGGEAETGASENPEQPAHPSASPATASGERDNDHAGLIKADVCPQAGQEIGHAHA